MSTLTELADRLDRCAALVRLADGALDPEVLERAAAELRLTQQPVNGELPACAAYWNCNNGLIVAGKHHADCIQKMHFAGLNHREFRDGFVSTRGRFLHRDEAFQLFVAAGLKSSSGTTSHGGWLLAGGKLDSGDLPGYPAEAAEKATQPTQEKS